jgi:hypothetical protein
MVKYEVDKYISEGELHSLRQYITTYQQKQIEQKLVNIQNKINRLKR